MQTSDEDRPMQAAAHQTSDAARSKSPDVAARRKQPDVTTSDPTGTAAQDPHREAATPSGADPTAAHKPRLDPKQPDVTAAYAECERIVGTEARNFSYGIRLLPQPKRQALSAVYAFARRVDDIGDGDLPAAEKTAALDRARKQAAAPGDFPDDPVLVALADSAARYPLDLGAFGELIDGCEMDQRGTVYRTWDDLAVYCRCVAGSIGRLSLGVFDPPSLRTEPSVPNALADTLGLALQLTNILRDLREDLTNGRVYLPQEDLEAHGCTLELNAQGSLDPQGGRLAALIRAEADRAEKLYAEGLGLLPLLDRRSRACCGALSGIYHALLRRIAAEPEAVLSTRVSVPTSRKLTVALGALLLPAQRS